jgi:predicted metal-dependent hydrolase
MLRLLQRDASRAPEITFIDVSHAAETYRVHLRRTAAARRFTLRVRTAGGDVVLTMPARSSLNEAKSFAARHAAWIGTKLRRLPENTRFEAGQSVPLRGVPHRIAHRPGLRGIVAIEAPNRKEIAAEPLLWVSGDPAFAPRRLRDFLIKEAKRDLENAVALHASRLGVKVRRITIRDTISRWGSCSASGALNFSWRLIMAPHFVLDYLAAHEVAHLAHMNHSDAFWRVVGRLSPDVEAAEAWLKANGSGLLRFGAGISGSRARS